uniref:Uncharacterized protein n=1 Tax=Noctiluca scintillans TaxID=2966 RepID=A0A7S1A476_NOCSC
MSISGRRTITGSNSPTNNRRTTVASPVSSSFTPLAASPTNGKRMTVATLSVGKRSTVRSSTRASVLAESLQRLQRRGTVKVFEEVTEEVKVPEPVFLNLSYMFLTRGQLRRLDLDMSEDTWTARLDYHYVAKQTHKIAEQFSMDFIVGAPGEEVVNAAVTVSRLDRHNEYDVVLTVNDVVVPYVQEDCDDQALEVVGKPVPGVHIPPPAVAPVKRGTVTTVTTVSGEENPIEVTRKSRRKLTTQFDIPEEGLESVSEFGVARGRGKSRSSSSGMSKRSSSSTSSSSSDSSTKADAMARRGSIQDRLSFVNARPSFLRRMSAASRRSSVASAVSFVSRASAISQWGNRSSFGGARGSIVVSESALLQELANDTMVEIRLLQEATKRLSASFAEVTSEHSNVSASIDKFLETATSGWEAHLEDKLTAAVDETYRSAIALPLTELTFATAQLRSGTVRAC